MKYTNLKILLLDRKMPGLHLNSTLLNRKLSHYVKRYQLV